MKDFLETNFAFVI